jgi:hypothetical protein
MFFFQLPPVIIKLNYYYLKSTGTKEQTGEKKERFLFGGETQKKKKVT